MGIFDIFRRKKKRQPVDIGRLKTTPVKMSIAPSVPMERRQPEREQSEHDFSLSPLNPVNMMLYGTMSAPAGDETPACTPHNSGWQTDGSYDYSSGSDSSSSDSSTSCSSD